MTRDDDRLPWSQSGLVIALLAILCWGLLIGVTEALTVVVDDVIAAVE